MNKYITIALLLTLVTACGSSTKSSELSPAELYTNAKDEISNGSTETAIEMLKDLQLLYPNSTYAIQSKIEVPYALLKSEKYDEAIIQLNRFIKLYPNNVATPYAYYLRGLIMERKASRSVLDKYAITDKAQRDIKTIRKSFDYYVELIKKFPKSKYSEEAKTKLIILKNILARHELYVAIFYADKKAYLAAIRRAKYIIEHYPKTPSIPAALVLLVENYNVVGATKLAQDAQRVLVKNYPTYKPHFK